METVGCRQGTKLIKFSGGGGGIHLGPSIKYLRKTLPIFDPPSPSVQNAYAMVLTPRPPSPLYARTQFDLVYTKYDKYNIELVILSPKLSFYASMSIFKYNTKLIRCKYL